MDIKSLEIEFAKNPKSEVFIDLCEAYIADKRFMEALVVCKKGIKNLPPDDLRGRLMLVKIFEAQGKKQKADQEMAQLQKEFPGHPMLTGGQAATAPAAAPAVAPATAPGAPGANPFNQPSPFAGAAGAAPSANPFNQPSPFAGAAGAAPGANPFEQPSPFAAAAGAAPGANPFEQTGGLFTQQSAGSTSDPKLEHVSDFFSQGALGFSNNTIPEGMTAGKGRLTIVGFIPTQSTSFKRTMIMLLGVIVVVAAFITWFTIDAGKQKEITKIFKGVKEQVDRDTYYNYKAALEDAQQIMAIDDDHHKTLCIMAYSYAALAMDHHVPGALEQAEKYVELAKKSSSESYSYGIAAEAMVQYMKGNYDKAITDLDAIIKAGAKADIIDLELFRLRSKARPTEDDTKKLLSSLNQSVGNVRIFTFLAEYYYNIGDFTKSGSMAGQGLNSNKEHPRVQAYIQLNLLPNEFDATGEMDKNLDKIAKLVSGEKGSQVDKAIVDMAFGMYHLKFLRNEEAEPYFAKVNRDDVPLPILYMRAKMFNENKLFDKALEDINYVLKKEDKRADYHLVLAEALIGKEDYEGADKAIAVAQKLEAENPRAAYLAAYALEQQGKKPEAIEAYGKVPNSNPDIYIDARSRAAHLMVAMGKKNDALKYVEDLLHAAPPGSMQPQQAKMLALYGEMFEATGKKDTAMETYIEAREMFRHYSLTHYLMCKMDKSAKSACKTYLRLTPWGEHRVDAAKRAGCDLNKLMECFAAP